jgi:hypothetical protein
MRKNSLGLFWMMVLMAGVLVLSGPAFAARGASPAAQKALASLKEARTQLSNATDDRGGHRAKAIDHVNNAIEQVEKSVAFGTKH